MKSIGRLLLVIFVLPNLAACGLAAPRIYSFHGTESNPEMFSSIKVEPHFGGGALVLRTLDGKDTKTHPQIVELMKANPGLPNLEPRHISVTPGIHSFGVLYLYTDLSKKLSTSKLATEFQKRYIPNNTDQYITVKHSEELTFQCKAASTYIIDRSWNEAATEISFSVRECDSTEKNCAAINIKRNKVKSTAVSGWSVSDIE